MGYQSLGPSPESTRLSIGVRTPACGWVSGTGSFDRLVAASRGSGPSAPWLGLHLPPPLHLHLLLLGPTPLSAAAARRTVMADSVVWVQCVHGGQFGSIVSQWGKCPGLCRCPAGQCVR